jgi:peptidoglycan/LPS O-acetylase OafA/YrhL
MSRDSANLDVLRAIAVLMVFCHHLFEFGYYSVKHVTGLGQFGVLIFFVHTSLVLMMSMERNSGALNFYIRRFFRIYPLSILVVGLVTVLRIPHDPALEFAPVGTMNLLSNFALTMNLTHSPVVLAPLWSLPLEVQMYAVLPLLFLVTKTSHAFRNLVLIWLALIPLAYFGGAATGPHSLVRFAPCFLGGVIGYVVLSKFKPKLAWFWWPPFILGAYVAYQFFDRRGLGWVECLVLGMAIPFFRAVQLPVVRQTAAAIAKYSYGIYLFHLIAMYYCFDLVTGPMWMKITASVTFTAVASVASYHLLEDPLINYGRRLGHALAPPRPEKPIPQAVGISQ